VYNKNYRQIINFILTELNIKHRVKEILNHHCSAPAASSNFHAYSIKYHRLNILVELPRWNTLNNLKNLISFLGGETDFVDAILTVDDYDENILEKAVHYDNAEIWQYILSLKEVKRKYQKNDALIFRLVYFLFAQSADVYTTKYVLKEMGITAEKVASLLTFKYPKSDRTFGDGAHKYDEYTIIGQMVVNKKMSLLKVVKEMVGDEAFADGVFMNDVSGEHALSKAIERNEVEIFEYLFNNVKQRLVNDSKELQALKEKLTEQKVNEWKSYQGDVDVAAMLNGVIQLQEQK